MNLIEIVPPTQFHAVVRLSKPEVHALRRAVQRWDFSDALEYSSFTRDQVTELVNTLIAIEKSL